jgi:phosphocarrier protein
VATRFPCDVEIAHADQVVNAKSVMGLLLLCGAKGSVIEVTATGDGAVEAVEAIGRLIAERFGEED